MTTYQVTAWCNFPHYTTFEVDARSPREALRKARQQALEESPEPCNGFTVEWDEFEICPEADDVKCRRYVEPAKRAEIAAMELLDALRQGTDAAQRVLDSWERGDLAASIRALSQWLSDARAAIIQATKG